MHLLRSFMVLAFITVFCNACVTTMTQQDLDAMHSAQLLTDFEDNFYITEIGLTVFENEAFRGDIAEWKLRDKLLSSLKAALPATVKVVDEKSFKTGTSMTEGWGTLAPAFRNDAQASKADTIIILSRYGFWNSAGGGYFEVHPERGGFGFYSRSLLGKAIRTCPFLSYIINVYRASDGKLLASGVDTICDNQSTVETAQEFASYSTEHKTFFRSTLEKAIESRFTGKVREVFTPAPAPAPGKKK